MDHNELGKVKNSFRCTKGTIKGCNNKTAKFTIIELKDNSHHDNILS